MPTFPNPSQSLRPGARLSAALVLGAVCLASQFISQGHSQAPSALDPRVAAVLTPLVDQLKAQQDEMVANQTKIEAQQALLREELRLVKIYSARGGSSLRH